MKKITLLALLVSAFAFMTAEEMDTTWVDFTGATAVSNSVYNSEAQYEGIMAVDVDSLTNVPNLNTRWATNLTAEDGSLDNGWTLEITFPDTVTFTHLSTYDFKGRVDTFAIEVLQDGATVEVFKGTEEKTEINTTVTLQTVKFDEAISTTQVTYRVCSTVEKAPSIWDLKLFTLNATSAVRTQEVSDMNIYVSQNILHVDNYTAKNSELSLYDISGRLALQKNLNATNTSVSVDALKSGIYVVRLENESGVFSEKVLVK